MLPTVVHCLGSMQELPGIEQELQAALAEGRADAFCAFLLGLVLLDRCGPTHTWVRLQQSSTWP